MRVQGVHNELMNPIVTEHIKENMSVMQKGEEKEIRKEEKNYNSWLMLLLSYRTYHGEA